MQRGRRPGPTILRRWGPGRPRQKLPAIVTPTPSPPTMPYFTTSAEWCEQSSLLLKARPTTVSGICHVLHTQTHQQSPDTHHVQVHGPQALGLEDQEAPKVCRQTSRQPRRRDAHIFAAATAAEPRGSHGNLHRQDVRPRIWHVFAVRDNQGRRSRTADWKPGPAREAHGCSA